MRPIGRSQSHDNHMTFNTAFLLSSNPLASDETFITSIYDALKLKISSGEIGIVHVFVMQAGFLISTEVCDYFLQ